MISRGLIQKIFNAIYKLIPVCNCNCFKLQTLPLLITQCPLFTINFWQNETMKTIEEAKIASNCGVFLFFNNKKNKQLADVAVLIESNNGQTLN